MLGMNYFFFLLFKILENPSSLNSKWYAEQISIYIMVSPIPNLSKFDSEYNTFKNEFIECK